MADPSDQNPPYCLAESFSGHPPIPITDQAFETYQSAITKIAAAREIENLFQVFAHSFLQFEKDLLMVALEYAYPAAPEPLWFDQFVNNVRQRLNLSILTILTAYRSYADQSDRILGHTNGLSAAREANQRASNKAYDAHFSYRICDQLRNYAQHHALPLGGFTIGGKAKVKTDNAGNKSKGAVEHSVSLYLDVPEVLNSQKIKTTLREELTKLGQDKIDMAWLIRAFAGAMYDRHATLRDVFKPKVEIAGEQVAAAYEIASTAKGSNVNFLDLRSNGSSRTMLRDLAEKTLREFGTYTCLSNAEVRSVTSRVEQSSDIYSGSKIK